MTTTWAALVSFLPAMLVVVLTYAVDSADVPASRVLRLGLSGWLLVHGVPLRTGVGPVGLVPLAVTGLAAWRVLRAGVHTARAVGTRRTRSTWQALAAGAGVGVVYGLIGALAALAARQPDLSVSVPRAGLTMAAFGLVFGQIGAAAESRSWARAGRLLPRLIRDALRTGTVATLLVFGGGAAAAGAAIALAGGDASQVIADYGTGVAGQAGLTLVCLMYAPTVAIWATSYLVGPGFVLGTGTTVSAAKVVLGPVPALPVLAGLPADAAPGWGPVLLGLPLAAGMTAGWLLVRRTRQAEAERRVALPTWPVLLGSAALAGPVTGAALWLASLAASGPLGSGHLATIGPRAVPVALVGTGIVALGAVLAAVATRLIVARRATV